MGETVYCDGSCQSYTHESIESAEQALAAAEQDVIGDFGEEGLEAGYADIVRSIAGDCEPGVAAELLRRKLGV
jgi:hypothetical protein